MFSMGLLCQIGLGDSIALKAKKPTITALPGRFTMFEHRVQGDCLLVNLKLQSRAKMQLI